MDTTKNLTIRTQRWIYFPASTRFEIACADESTRHCRSLAEATGELVRLFSDAYLMGGEL